MAMYMLRRWFASVLLVGALAAPASAQELHDLFQKRERNPPVPQYALGALGIMLVMSIVCYPSRKW